MNRHLLLLALCKGLFLTNNVGSLLPLAMIAAALLWLAGLHRRAIAPAA